MSLERAVSQKDAHNYLQEYSIKLGPGDDPNNPASEQRGVMVIKSKSKTRAKQRKGAVANWKVINLNYIFTFSKPSLIIYFFNCCYYYDVIYLVFSFFFLLFVTLNLLESWQSDNNGIEEAWNDW